MEDASSLSLFIIFVQGFNVSNIYEIGWEAAREWMALASGVLLAISISIRSAEEKVNLLSGGQGGYMKMVVNVFIIAMAIALYFVIAELVINLFNAMYGVMENSQVVEMGNRLDETMAELHKKDHKFAWSEVGDAVFSGFAMIAYWMSHMALILVTVALRIAHALLVSWCLFFGAVALPLSVTTGLKMLTPFRNLALMVLLWPLVESFFMFAISGSFTAMLNSSQLDVSQFKTWNMGVMVFYLTAFAIINLLLCAALIGAPFVAQGLANGSGNVTGIVGAFAGAGITAGVVAAKTMMPKAVVDGAKNSILGSFKSLGSSAAGSLGGGKIAQMANKDIWPVKSQGASGGKGSYSRETSSVKKETTSTSTKSTNTNSNPGTSAQSATPSTNNTNSASAATKPLAANALSAEDDLSDNPSEKTTELEANTGNLSDEQRKKKIRSGKEGYFINKAKLNPKPPK